MKLWIKALFSSTDPTASVKKVSLFFALVMAAVWLSIGVWKTGITTEWNVAFALFMSTATSVYLGGKYLNNKRDQGPTESGQ